MDLVTRLPISTNLKGKTYEFIFVIIDQLIKMVHYKLVKATINVHGLGKVIIDVLV